MNWTRIRHLATWEARELVRDPFVAGWLAGTAGIVYVLGFVFGIFGEETESALASFLVLGVVGLAFLPLGRRGPTREVAWSRRLRTYPLSKREIFFGKVLGLASHAFVYLVLVSPGLAWYGYKLPGTRPLILSGLVAYPLVVASMLSLGMIVLGSESGKPLRWQTLIAVTLLVPWWLTQISAEGVGMHTVFSLSPVVTASHLVDAYPAIDARLAWAWVGLILAAGLLGVLAYRVWVRRRGTGLLVGALVVGLLGSAAALASTIDIDHRFNVRELESNIGTTLYLEDHDEPLHRTGISVPIGEPVEVTVRIRIREPPEQPVGIELHGEDIHVEGGSGLFPAKQTHYWLNATLTLEPQRDLEPTYILRSEARWGQTTRTGGTLIEGHLDGFTEGFFRASVASLLPVVLVYRRQRMLDEGAP